MLLKDAFATAFTSLKHARTRSFLTMLGIVIGIGSVILLMSLGQSAQNLIIDQVQSIGSNLIFAIPGATKGSRLSSPPSAQGIIIKTLVKQDVDALKRDPTVEQVVPQVQGMARAVSDTNDTDVTFQGVSANFFAVRNFNVVKGSSFTEEDVNSMNNVAVIGQSIATTLFGTDNPVGQVFRLKNLSFRIIGLLEKKGVGVGGVDQDSVVILPVSVAQKKLLGQDYYSYITIQAGAKYDPTFVKGRVENILRDSHHITNPDKDDFTVRTQEEALAIVSNITSVLTIFLSAIAAISLIVGGIGIMNIMLVSVLERTKEIGLRKAVGATNRDIMQQFLFESIMLTFAGGMVGLLIGVSVNALIYLVLVYFVQMTWSFALPLSAVLLALGVSTLTGLAFGIYPARQAAQKSPIEALRYE